MQRLESDLVIGAACERLRREVPDACVLTVHDCLVTTEEHTEHFPRVIQDVFFQAHQVRPRLRCEPFGSC